MRGQISQLVKRLVTLCTLVWLFTCVSSEVPGQMTRVAKRLVSLCTLIWLFTCVSTEVRVQIPQVVKRLVTLCTLMWLFTCVSTEMIGQKKRSLVVRKNTFVDLEIVRRCKFLFTSITVPCSFSRS